MPHVSLGEAWYGSVTHVTHSPVEHSQRKVTLPFPAAPLSWEMCSSLSIRARALFPFWSIYGVPSLRKLSSLYQSCPFDFFLFLPSVIFIISVFFQLSVPSEIIIGSKVYPVIGFSQYLANVWLNQGTLHLCCNPETPGFSSARREPAES